MLGSVQQLVLSELLRRGVSFTRAEAIAKGVPAGQPFDEALSRALLSVARSK